MMKKMQDSGFLAKVNGVSGLIIGVMLLFFNLSSFDGFIRYLETNVSPDGQLNAITKIILQGFVFMVVLLCFATGILFLTKRHKSFFAFIQRKTSGFIASFIDFRAVKEVFIFDNNVLLTKFNVWVLLVSAIVGLALHLAYLFNGLPLYEGIYEDISTSVLFLASVFFFISAGLNCPNHELKTESWKVKTVLLVVGFVVLVMVGEELSWGQHIFKWKSTGVFEEYNYQQETNLHNFINPVLPLFYPFVGMTTFIVLILTWFFPSGEKGLMQRIFIPPPSFFILFFFMACTGFYGPSEIFEALLSVGIFLYGIRILLSLKYGMGNDKT